MTVTETSALPPPVPPPVPDTAEGVVNRWSRWSDWLNPIVVREVQQALKGRAFVLSVFIALVVIVAIALAVASEFDPDSSGRDAFDAGLATLVPLLIFVVPMLAYQSMRHELKVGMVEQLMLSELDPYRIITGKLVAAMVQFLLYVSVIAPLLATSYLLRGVDMPTIGISLMFALLFCVTATAFAVSSAAQSVVPAMQGIANLTVAVTLAFASMAFIGYVGSGEYARDVSWLVRSDEMLMVVSLFVLGGMVSCILSALSAASFLAHAYENKSTGFRVFLFCIVVVALGWVVLFVDARSVPEVNAVMLFVLLLIGTTFGVFMVTEQKELSPRVQAHVPMRGSAALLAAVFLPGRQRGMLCFVVYLAVLGGCAAICWPMLHGPGITARFADEIRRISLFTAGYAVIYLSIGTWVRARLPKSVSGNHLARFAVPIAVLLFCMVPALIDVFVRGAVQHWHFGHIMNPFWTMGRYADRERGDEIVVYLLVFAGALLLVQLPSLIGGVREVLGASARRRDRVRQVAEEAGAE